MPAAAESDCVGPPLLTNFALYFGSTFCVGIFGVAVIIFYTPAFAPEKSACFIVGIVRGLYAPGLYCVAFYQPPYMFATLPATLAPIPPPANPGSFSTVSAVGYPLFIAFNSL
jgi:hypothetical protein